MPWQAAEEEDHLVRAEGTEKVSANAHLIEQANRRSLGYWILSGMFLEVPTAARVEELRRMLDGESAESGDVAELCRQLDAARFNLNDAAGAFTRHPVDGERSG